MYVSAPSPQLVSWQLPLLEIFALDQGELIKQENGIVMGSGRDLQPKLPMMTVVLLWVSHGR